MKRHTGQQNLRSGIHLRDQTQVQFVLLLRESFGQKRGHLLRASAAEMRNQQEEPWA